MVSFYSCEPSPHKLSGTFVNDDQTDSILIDCDLNITMPHNNKAIPPEGYDTNVKQIRTKMDKKVYTLAVQVDSISWSFATYYLLEDRIEMGGQNFNQTLMKSCRQRPISVNIN